MKRRYYLNLASLSFKFRIKIRVEYKDFKADRIKITICIITCRY